MTNPIKVLVVDDEADILEILEYNLTKENFKVYTASDGLEGYDMACEVKPHIAILDIMMPGMDGIELCAKIRTLEFSDEILICFLTARSESFTHISALESGGDDFVTKPIKPKVLISRIKALLRRHPKYRAIYDHGPMVFGELEINYDQYEVKIKEERISLAKKEFDLLKLLTSRPGKVYERQEILAKVWGLDVIVGDRTIDVHIRKLREKIGSHYIHTIKGVGYKFDF